MKEPFVWTDTHCHPFHNLYEDVQPETLLQEAREKGVHRFLTVGYNEEGNRICQKLAHEHEDVFYAVGAHPCDLSAWTDSEQAWIYNQREDAKLVALGEMGLDVYHQDYSLSEQEPVFREQIRLAKAMNRPCIIHSRDIPDRTLEILLEEKAEKVIFHCFSYDLPFAQKVWEAGYYSSFACQVTYPKSEALRDVVRHAPINQVFLETDAPFLAPQQYRGQKNSMAHVVTLAHFVAELRQMPLEELSLRLEGNWLRLF